MPKAKINGIHLSYELEGKGHPLVLIAGYSSDHHNWDGVRDELSKHFQLVLLDNRGIGQSESTHRSYTIEDMASDVIGLIDHLGLKKPHILGSSMGAAVAQTVAAKHASSIHKAMLVHPFLKIAPINATVIQFFFHLRMDGVAIPRIFEGIMPWLFSNDFMDNTKRVAENIDRVAKEPYPQSEHDQKFQMEALFQFDSTRWFKTIHTPLLVLTGEDDILCRPHDIVMEAKRMSNAKTVSIPKMGHAFQVEKPMEFTQIAIEFLK